MNIAQYITFRAAFSTGTTLDVAGYEVWPSAKVRSGGFTSSITGIPTSSASVSLPITVTCNAGASDAVAGTDDYDYYLSQRNDTAATHWLTPTAVSGKSGSVSIGLSAAGLSKFPTLDENALIALFKDVTIYFRRRSDGAIQLAEITKVMFSDAS